MVKKIDMTNKKIGRLLVLEEIKKEGKKGVWYKCLCDCGKYTETKGEYLRTETQNHVAVYMELIQGYAVILYI